MARVNNLSNFLTDVASAIKTKKGSETNIPAANFDTEILALPSQGVYEQRVLNISANGSQTITPGAGFDAIDELTLTVAVPEKQLQSKTYNFTQNTNIELLPDTGYDGFDSVTLNINVPGGSINNQNKTITPTTSQQVISADQGYTGLGNVTVNAVTSSIDQNIIASNIKDGVTILGVTGSNTYNSYEVVDYYDTNNITNPQINDICAVNNSWYNSTYINNIRTLLNTKYERDYGQGSHQNNNIILYDVNSEQYYAIYKQNINTETFSWDDGHWSIDISSIPGDTVTRWRDPAKVFNNQQLYRYLPSDNTLELVSSVWAVPFPTYDVGVYSFNFLIAYADKYVVTNVPVVYKDESYANGDFIYEDNISNECEVYKYNGTTWTNISISITNNQYQTMVKDTNYILYGKEQL